MRIAIVSDLHANLQATEAVGRDIERQSVDTTWSLGDVVGYGANPRETLAWVLKNATVRLQGNHDYAVATADASLFNPVARDAAMHHHDLLSRSDRQTLLSWPAYEPVTPDSLDVLLAHGSPDEPLWEYVPPSAAPSGIARWRGRARIILLGHTHQPFAAQTPSDPWTARHFLQSLVCGEAGGAPLLLVNPGSVGQPRDGDPRASYAILDTKARAVELRRIPYDVDAAAAAIEDAGLPSLLASRLYKGL